MTDFANAALTVFTVLLSRVVLFFNLNVYVPVSLVDANMVTASKRGAAQFGRFYFRKRITPNSWSASPTGSASTAADPWTLMSLEEVLMGLPAGPGAESEFPGLMPLIFAYLDLIGCEETVHKQLEVYLSFLVARARGEIPTEAEWMRRFIAAHPDYHGDSVVSEAVAHDLLVEIDRVERGVRPAADLLGAVADAAHRHNRRAATLEAAAAEAAAADSAALDAALVDAIPDLAEARSSGDADARKLRGASFAEEMASSRSGVVVRALLNRHTVRDSFSSTPAFFSGLGPRPA